MILISELYLILHDIGWAFDKVFSGHDNIYIDVTQ